MPDRKARIDVVQIWRLAIEEIVTPGSSEAPAKRSTRKRKTEAEGEAEAEAKA